MKETTDLTRPGALSSAARHYEESVHIPASASQVFGFVDDHARLSAHMSRSSWMMGGGHMETEVDAGHGRRFGSHIRLSGKVLGISLFLDEVVTLYEPPFRKAWQTVGVPKLLVIGHYRMGFEISPHNRGATLTVFIDYELPPAPSTRWPGVLFGGLYARWCVRQMTRSARAGFESADTLPSA